MATRDAGPLSSRSDAESTDRETDRELRLLRARWRTASLANGWRFPSDWPVPEVDAVCSSLIGHQFDIGAVSPALVSLARARAQSGAGLEETLIDLAALHAVIRDPASVEGLVSADLDATPGRLIRAAALAWADESFGVLSVQGATQPLTGLPTHAYLRTRLGEVYRQALRDGRTVRDSHALLVITLDLAEVSGWPRVLAMVLVADVLRELFNGGESSAVLGPSVAVVLAEREPSFGHRALSAGWLITERMYCDPQLRPASCPHMRVVGLPDTEEQACQLLHQLSRA